ncbi:WD40 repeat-like protein [Rozella allomycis CSF55]|uniref:WD40 repeat-like protein n=1 Tax=Rozella allomycis (strain CSF55) TaxID=988480 RepID=A0A075AYU7_ROZAC|nr:hypothetical protein O9G_000695 [Rozella allomycis CSF55]RKP19922.1 WD40 repeat-like protein [Rozella allomycis CSF55]|eukprot:EPZ35299.1 hypothetical protein O9G_000695 [Rozella allomycis CSF55]
MRLLDIEKKGKFSNNHIKLKRHFSCVNALSITNGDGQFLASGGDVLVSDLYDPEFKIKETYLGHQNNIFSLSFSLDNKLLFSAGLDSLTYLHDRTTGVSTEYRGHDGPVYCVQSSIHDLNIFYTTSEDGAVYVRDTRTDKPVSIIDYDVPIHCIREHPFKNNALVISGKSGHLEMLDFRTLNQTPHPILKYSTSFKDCSSNRSILPTVGNVHFTKDGSRFMTTNMSALPMIYDTYESHPLYCCYHKNYQNVCTMKHHCFGGQNDEFIIAGSDDYNVYVWKTPNTDSLVTNKQYFIKSEIEDSTNWVPLRVHDKVDQVLRENQSHPNTTIYHPVFPWILTSGVEKTIGIYSPLPIPTTLPPVSKVNQDARRDLVRLIRARPIFLAYLMARDGPDDSLDEDPRTLALFDILNEDESDYQGYNHEDDEEE